MEENALLHSVIQEWFEKVVDHVEDPGFIDDVDSMDLDRKWRLKEDSDGSIASTITVICLDELLKATMMGYIFLKTEE